jgi:quercetin dioxygenase-like cupin family protein
MSDDVGYRTFPLGELDFTSPSRGDQSRGVCRLSAALGAMRANVWRMPSGSEGRRHRELVQEELFIVLEGVATLTIGQPGESVDLPTGSITVVAPQTVSHLANNAPTDAIVLIVGAPPEEGLVEYFPESADA